MPTAKRMPIAGKASTRAISTVELTERKTSFDSHLRTRSAATAKAEIIAALRADQLGDHEVLAMRAFLEVAYVYDGNGKTPIEDCILTIVRRHGDAIRAGQDYLTPDDLVDIIEGPDGCRSWFDDAVAIARRFRSRHAHLLDKADADEKAAGQ